MAKTEEEAIAKWNAPGDKIRDLEAEVLELRQKNILACENLDSYRGENQSLVNQLNSLYDDRRGDGCNNKLREETAALKEEVERIRKAFIEEQEGRFFSNQDMRERLDNMHFRESGMQSENAALKAEVARQQDQLENMRLEIHRWIVERDTVARSLKAAQDQIAEGSKCLLSMKSQLDGAKASEIRWSEACSLLREERYQLLAKIADLEQRLSGAVSPPDELEEAVSNFILGCDHDEELRDLFRTIVSAIRELRARK